MNTFKSYFKEIHKIDPSKTTEKSYRTYIHNFLNDISKKIDKKIEVIHEHKKEVFGQPDFKVLKNEGLLGYIETKPLNDNLDNYLKTEQLQRYLPIIRNFILTNYNDFVLFRDGKEVLRKRLFNISDKKLEIYNINSVNEILNQFFTLPVEQITTPERLSSLLSLRTKYLKESVKEYWSEESSTIYRKKLQGLFDLFKDTLIEDIEEDEFFDTYSQTITYGLFLSKLNVNGSIDKRTSFLYIPKTLGVIEEIFELFKLTDIPDTISWIIDDIIEILNIVDIENLKTNLSSNKEYDYKDPYVYFYEQFLYKYDKEKRKSMGVYYTPIPVVHFIVHSIEKILQRDFDKTGFDDEDITVLDFATGTGTFLLETFKTTLEKIDKDLRIHFIRERLLKCFFGFEYLISPYTICHLKLTQYLDEYNFHFRDDERIGVYLTDTLDNKNYFANTLYPNISNESIQSYDIKIEKPIMIVMGNPPYNIHSRNKKEFILGLLKDYKKGLGEKKSNIDDDYIKFIRYGQWKIDTSGNGILGVITNNSYLDGITHRVMRKHLLSSFDKIYICNLHGHEIDDDENVFNNIRLGVSIVLFVKLTNSLNKKEVYYFSTKTNGLLKRDDKFEFLRKTNYEDINWTKIEPSSPNFWFVPKKYELENEYNKGWGLNDIFDVFGSGVKTDRDSLFIDYDKDLLKNRIEKLLSGNFDDEFIQKYGVANSSSYRLIDKISDKTFTIDNIIPIHYRPFDRRWCYYQKGLTSRPNVKVTKHIINKENLGLISVRQYIEDKIFNYCFITNIVPDIRITVSNRGTGYLFPLYVYFEKDKGSMFRAKNGNFQSKFLKKLKEKYGEEYSAEEILGYIYGILHSPTYRINYSEFLKTDFPKIPLVANTRNFKNISKLGTEIIHHHLLTQQYPKKELPMFIGEGDFLVDNISYDSDRGKLYINKKQYFQKIPPEIYNFEIGGYSVLQTFLKYRRGKYLSISEISMIKNMSISLLFTQKQMERIDEVTKDWI